MNGVAAGLDGVQSNWDYHDKHLTGLTDKNFMSSMRCIVYARPSRVSADGADASFKKLGVVQAYSWGEQKQVEMIFELGSDIPYLIPGRTTGSVNIARVLVAGADLVNVMYGDTDSIADGNMVMGEWIRSLRDITIPVDMLLAYYDQSSEAVYTRIFSHCQITQRNESIQAGSVIVSENVSLLYQHVAQYNTAGGSSINNPVRMYG